MSSINIKYFFPRIDPSDSLDRVRQPYKGNNDVIILCYDGDGRSPFLLWKSESRDHSTIFLFAVKTMCPLKIESGETEISKECKNGNLR